MSKAAMISYNAFLGGAPNGWVNDSLFVIQNDNGEKWGEPQYAPLPLVDQVRRAAEKSVTNKVGRHWEQLSEHLPSFDTVVIYVGDRGSEHTIRHAALHKLDPSKAVFVLCDCNLDAKESAISKHGFAESRRVMCECGGHATMQSMARHFIATGSIAQF